MEQEKKKTPHKKEKRQSSSRDAPCRLPPNLGPDARFPSTGKWRDAQFVEIEWARAFSGRIANAKPAARLIRFLSFKYSRRRDSTLFLKFKTDFHYFPEANLIN